MRKGLVAVGAAVILAGGAFAVYHFGGFSAQASTESEPKNEVSGPVKADNKVVADARVVPVRHAALTFPVGGTVAEVLVAEGAPVKAGQVIARLSAANQRAALGQAEAQLQRAQARLSELTAGPRYEEIASARAALDAAHARLTQVKQGTEQDEVDTAVAEVNRIQAQLTAAIQAGRQADIDSAQSALSAAESRLVKLTRSAGTGELQAAEADVKRAQAQLDLVVAGARSETIASAAADVKAAVYGVEQAKAALENTELVMPFDGTVVVSDLKAGETVSPGTQVVRVADLSEWELVTEDLTELSVARIREGAPATIRFDAIPDLELPGKVSRIRLWGERRQGDITFTVGIKPDRLDERLRWNMTASITIQGR